MNPPKRNRARVLTLDGLKKLREQIRSHEIEENAGYKYTLEKLGELTGLDPETVRNVLDCRGSDKRTIVRCFETFGLTLEDIDHSPATQASAATADSNFVGRDEAIADLDELVRQNKKLILILGGAGFGKTTLARKYLDQRFDRVIKFVLAKERKDVASVEGLVEQKLKELGEEPGREFAVSLERLRRKLETEKIGILIDNLEPALEGNGCFVPERRPYVELLRVLAADTVQSVTLITSRDPLHEPALTVTPYPLKGLSLEAWQQFFADPQLNPQIVMDLPILTDMHRQYGGNAKAMELLRGAVQQDNGGNLQAYWERNRDDLLRNPGLENLVIEQFKRLQEVAPNAYTLLCRLGCYRYQSVPTLPMEGLLCLLWDVPERKMRVVDALKGRSLVEFRNDEYWLHPMIREEAIARLRSNTEDWKVTNHKTAEFWTNHVKTVETSKDAVEAFEAYHQFLEVNDFKSAAEVIIRERENRWAKISPLGVSFYRLGLLSQIIRSIIFIESEIEAGYPKSRILNILGDSCWMLGNIHEAIKYHEISGRIAIEQREILSNQEGLEEIKLRLRRCEIAALLNIGLCKIDLCEIEEAVKIFQKVSSFPDTNDFSTEPVVSSWFCLAYLNARIGSYEKSKQYIEKATSFLNISKSHTEWGIGYRSLFLGMTYKNLGETKKSFEFYQKAISYADECYYIQLKAKALCCLAELYRDQRDFEQALPYHLESIEFLKEISAKCDLAEACYQLGLTYQAMGEIEKGNKNLQEAIRLFSEIEAPKQVERVRQSIQNEQWEIGQ